MSSYRFEELHHRTRPPVAMDAASNSGLSSSPFIRTSAKTRPLVTPHLLEGNEAGHEPRSPYVRRWWTAAIGHSAVTELLRLIAAAHTKTPIRRPFSLDQLARESLVLLVGDQVAVRPTIPSLGPRQLNRLHPHMRAEHQTELG